MSTTTSTPPVTLNELTPKELCQLVQNEESLSGRTPAATQKNLPVAVRATFKVSLLRELLRQIETEQRKQIEKHPEQKNEDYHHMVCITFIRDDLNTNNSILKYDHCMNAAALHGDGTQVNGSTFTRVVPIITGCHAHYNNLTGECKDFKYMRNEKGKIPYVRSGGETSGLIPPKPTGGDETYS